MDHNVRYVAAAAPGQREDHSVSDPIISGIDLVPLDQTDIGML